MADINFKTAPAAPKMAQDSTSVPGSGTQPSTPYDLIELLFFAYRDFTADPDQLLSGLEFGRAHHRVLHFVDRNPGIRVSDLLAILRITKQSLGRVLKQLVDEGFIDQRPGETDRRQRLLHTTDKGHKLSRKLDALQAVRINAAVDALPGQDAAIVRQFLFQMIDPERRPEVARMLSNIPQTGSSGPEPQLADTEA